MTWCPKPLISFSIVALCAILVFGVFLFYHPSPPPVAPWTWKTVVLNPSAVTRERIMLGVDVQVCKTGTWHYLPLSAVTVQDAVPAAKRGDKISIINGGSKPLGTHHVDLPIVAGEVDQCRPSPLRLDTGMGVGWWLIRLDTRPTLKKFGEVQYPQMVFLAPFEVTQ